MDEHDITNTESSSQSDTENTEAEISDQQNGAAVDSESGQQTVVLQEIDYSEQLQHMYEVQQIGVGLSCIIIGLLLVDIVFNVLKRFF